MNVMVGNGSEKRLKGSTSRYDRTSLMARGRVEG